MSLEKQSTKGQTTTMDDSDCGLCKYGSYKTVKPVLTKHVFDITNFK